MYSMFFFYYKLIGGDTVYITFDFIRTMKGPESVNLIYL